MASVSAAYCIYVYQRSAIRVLYICVSEISDVHNVYICMPRVVVARAGVTRVPDRIKADTPRVSLPSSAFPFFPPVRTNASFTLSCVQGHLFGFGHDPVL